MPTGKNAQKRDQRWLTGEEKLKREGDHQEQTVPPLSIEKRSLNQWIQNDKDIDPKHETDTKTQSQDRGTGTKVTWVK